VANITLDIHFGTEGVSKFLNWGLQSKWANDNPCTRQVNLSGLGFREENRNKLHFVKHLHEVANGLGRETLVSRCNN
jgi:hypothetical protein